MAELDALSLRVELLDKASPALEKLTDNLTELGKSLGKIKTTNIDKLVTSMNQLSNLTSLNTATRSVDQLARDFVKLNGINRSALPEITEQFEKLFKVFSSGVSGKERRDAFDNISMGVFEIASNNKILHKKVDDTEAEIKRYVNAFSKKYNKYVGIADLAGEFGDKASFDDFAKRLGSAFDPKKIGGDASISFDSFLSRLQSKIPGAEEFLDFSNPLNAAKQLHDVLRNATDEAVKFRDALLKTGDADFVNKYFGNENPKDVERAYWESQEEALKNVAKLGKAYNGVDATTADSIFGELNDAFNEMKDIQIPDFSGLTTLADGMKALGADSVSKGADNIPKIADALDKLKGIEVPQIDGLSQLASDISKISGANLKDITQTANTSGTKAAPEYTPNVSETIKLLDDLEQAASNVEQLGGQVFEPLEQGAEEFTSKIGNLKDMLSDLYEEQANPEWIPHIEDDGQEEAKLQRTSKASTDLVANLLALGHEIDNISKGFDKMGDIGIKALTTMYKPLGHIFGEYKEKLGGIVSSFANMSKNVQAHLKKMSDFWKRSMRTFTFMVVRKAITAVIEEMGNAVKSLAQFESAVGGQFNSSISNLTADLSYMARAILGAFEPLINVLVPILDMIAEKIAYVMSLIGAFFAAFTGQNYYVKAKKDVQDYAASLDKANKSQKNLTMGIDELNILNDNNSGGGGGGAGNPMEEWEKLDIPDWANDLADKIKDILRQLFEPFKKAWDNAKEYVISGFKYMVDELGKLLATIGRDFLKVWNEPETIRILTQIFMIIGDIERVIGNLAKRFREAWEEGEKGLHILQNIRDIFGILIDHLRNVTEYMVGWSDQLDFNPLFEAVERLTVSLKSVAEFIGGVFEDVMEKGILKYVEWWIEEGAPHTLNTIKEIIDAFNFEKIRADLNILIVAFEQMLENIHTGVTDAMGNVGKALAEWMNSEEFTKFMEALAHFMDLITAERVEKLFTALGMGILDTAENLAKFVSSDAFINFVDKLVEWYDSKSAEEIAGVLEKIALAIAGFKFAAFVGEGIAGFFQFLIMVQSAQNISGILTAMGGGAEVAGAGAEAAAGGFAGLGGSMLPIAGIAAGVILAVDSLVASFGGIKGLIEEIKGRVAEFNNFMGELANKLNISTQVDMLKSSFGNLQESLGGFRTLWETILDKIQLMATVIGGTLLPVFGGLVETLAGIIDFFAGMLKAVSGVIDILTKLDGVFQAIDKVIIGFFTDTEKFNEGLSETGKAFQNMGDAATKVVDGIKLAFKGMAESVAGVVDGLVGGTVGMFSSLKYQLVGDPIVLDMWDDIKSAFSGGSEEASGSVDGMQDSVTSSFGGLKDSISTESEGIRGAISKSLSPIAEEADSTFRGMAKNIVGWFAYSGDESVNKADLMMTKINAKFVAIRLTVESNLKDITGLFTNMLSEGQGIFNTFLDGVMGWLTILRDRSMEMLISIVDGVKLFIGEKHAEITEILMLNVETITSLFTEMVMMIESSFTSLVENVVGAFTTIRDNSILALTEMSEGISEVFTGVVDIVVSFVESVTEAFNGMVEEVRNIIQELTRTVVDQFRQLENSLLNSMHNIRDRIVSQFTDIKQRVTQVVNQMHQEVVRKFDDMQKSIVNKTNNIKQELVNKWNTIKQELVNKVQELKQKIDDNFDKIQQKVRDKCEKIKDHINKLGDILRDFASDNLQRWRESWHEVWNEIQSITNEACEAILETIRNMVAEAQALFESLQYHLTGDPIVVDMWNEIMDLFDDGAKHSVATVDELADSVADSFDGIADTLDGDMFDTFISGAADSMDAVISVVDGAMSDIKDALGDSLQFPEMDIPTYKVNTEWANATQIPDYRELGGFARTAFNNMEGISNDDVRNVVSEQSDQEQRLMNQMIDLLETIARKDTNIYMDSRSLVSGISNRQRRNGFDFRIA